MVLPVLPLKSGLAKTPSFAFQISKIHHRPASKIAAEERNEFMNQLDTPKSEPVEEPTIEEGLYSWWAGGVIAGAIVLAIIAAIAFGGVELPLACVGAALFYLICFDTHGNFKRTRGMLLGGVLLFIGTTLLHKKPPRLSVIIVGTTLF